MTEQEKQPEQEPKTEPAKKWHVKPCPNGKCLGRKIQLHTSPNKKFYAVCNKCGLTGPISNSQKEAVDLWNGLLRVGEPYGERCFFNLHDWAKWEDYQERQRIQHRDNGGDISKGTYLIQKRWCKRCGEVEFKSKRIFDVDKDT